MKKLVFGAAIALMMAFSMPRAVKADVAWGCNYHFDSAALLELASEPGMDQAAAWHQAFHTMCPDLEWMGFYWWEAEYIYGNLSSENRWCFDDLTVCHDLPGGFAYQAMLAEFNYLEQQFHLAWSDPAYGG